MDDWISIKY